MAGVAESVSDHDREFYDGELLMARAPKTDAGLATIDELERCMILAHDEKAQLGVSPEEVARLRPGVVALAKAVTDRMRDEYRARSRHR